MHAPEFQSGMLCTCACVYTFLHVDLFSAYMYTYTGYTLSVDDLHVQLCSGWLATDQLSYGPINQAQDHPCGHSGAAGL